MVFLELSIELSVNFEIFYGVGILETDGNN